MVPSAGLETCHLSLLPTRPPPERVTAGLQSGQWGRKKAAAAALSQICATSGDALAPHLPAVLDALLKVRGMPALLLRVAVAGHIGVWVQL